MSLVKFYCLLTGSTNMTTTSRSSCQDDDMRLYRRLVSGGSTPVRGQRITVNIRRTCDGPALQRVATHLESLLWDSCGVKCESKCVMFHTNASFSTRMDIKWDQ